MGERLQKLLARHGLGSRREVESWIVAGRILLNGQPATLGDRFSPGDRVSIDGRDVTARLATETAGQVLVYNKPPGQALFAIPDEQTRTSAMLPVLESLPARRGMRWLAVNPMSPGDSGLLLLSTDGGLVDALMRRSAALPAVYAVRVHVPGEAATPPEPGREVICDNQRVVFDAVELTGGEGANYWFRVTSSRADRRAALRALFESRGLKVSRVIQLRYANVELPRDLPRGRHRPLAAEACAALYRLAGRPAPVEGETSVLETRFKRSGRRREVPRNGRRQTRRKPR